MKLIVDSQCRVGFLNVLKLGARTVALSFVFVAMSPPAFGGALNGVNGFDLPFRPALALCIAIPDGAGETPVAHLRTVDPGPLPADQRRLQIIWGIALGLTILCYLTMAATARSLKKLASRVDTIETSLDGISGTANEANTSARAVMQVLRPWIAVSFEPVRGKDGVYGIVATNRGTSPAHLVGTMDRVGLLTDESCLPATPEFARAPRTPTHPLILIPGESVLLQTFGQVDLSWVCKTRDQLRRIENGQIRAILYGRVLYRSQTGETPNETALETAWCCRYVHTDSGGILISTGPPEYRKHT